MNMTKETDSQRFGGLILAGGKSSRMGADKAELVYKGERLIDHARAVLKELGADPVLVSGREGGLNDPTPGLGPVGGLCALVDEISHKALPKKWLVIPVDMPLLSKETLEPLLKAKEQIAYFVAHPLPAKLNFCASQAPYFDVAKRDMNAGRSVSVRRLITALGGVSIMPTSEIARSLVNVNSPEEWAALNES